MPPSVTEPPTYFCKLDRGEEWYMYHEAESYEDAAKQFAETLARAEFTADQTRNPEFTIRVRFGDELGIICVIETAMRLEVNTKMLRAVGMRSAVSSADEKRR